MANKNRHTKARRVKEVKEIKHKKTSEKPIYKRPWVWIVLIAIVAGITVPSLIQWQQQSQEQAVLDAAVKEAQETQETLVWDSLKEPLSSIGVTESAIEDKSYQFLSTTTDGAVTTSGAFEDNNLALVTIKTDIRTIIAQVMKQAPIVMTTDGAVTDGAATGGGESVWTCSMIVDDKGEHIYWSSFTQGAENATQTAIQDSNGSWSMAPLYNYLTDKLVPGATTAPAVTSESEAETTDGAVKDKKDKAETTGGAVTSSSATSGGGAQ